MNLRQLWYLHDVYKEDIPMLGTLLAGGQWINVVVLVAQLLNDATGYFPALQNNHWFVMLQGILAVILPSIAHPINKAAVMAKEAAK